MVEAVSQSPSLSHVLNHLDQLPAKLDGLYRDAFTRIAMQSEENAWIARSALTWVAFAEGPLSIEDLRYAVARDPEVDWASPENLTPVSTLLCLCAGLLTIEQGDDKQDDDEDRTGFGTSSSPYHLDTLGPGSRVRLVRKCTSSKPTAVILPLV